MIKIFCGERGTGKTKSMIDRANQNADKARGTLVYIDDDDKRSIEVDKRVRFISTNEFGISSYASLYGLISGVVAQDYDLEGIYVDELSNITKEDVKESEEFLKSLRHMAIKYNLNVYMNVAIGDDSAPEFMKKYIDIA